MAHSRRRRSRRKASRGCVGSVSHHSCIQNFFFSSWPHEDRVVLRSLYDRHVANKVVVIRQNAAAGGRRRGNCSQRSLWDSIARTLQSSCNQYVQAKEIENFFKKIICGVTTLNEVSGLLDYMLLRKQPSLSAVNTNDVAGGRGEYGNHSEHERGELKKAVDAPQPQMPWSNASHIKEHDEQQDTDARCVDGMPERSPNEMNSLLEHLQDASDDAIDDVPASTPTDCVVLGAADQVDVASEYPENDAAAGVIGESIAFEIFTTTSGSADEGVILAPGLSLARDAEGLEHEDDAAVETVEDITDFQVPVVGAMIELPFTDCGPGDTEAINSSICGSPCEGLFSADYVIGENGSGESILEKVFQSPCENLCSESNRSEKEVQYTTDKFDQEVQCDMVSYYLEELMDEEISLELEISELSQKVFDMEKPPQ